MKLKTLYKCQNCGFTSAKWMGQCPECQKWNSLLEEVVQVSSGKTKTRKLTDFSSEVVKLSESQKTEIERLKIDGSELDRLVGGGLVRGQMVLLAGPPGIGKSTLMLQMANALAKTKKVLYVSGEESIEQVTSRAQRLGISSEQIYLLSETNLESIISVYNKLKPEILIIDSIQTVYHPDFNSGPGTISQVRESTSELLRITKPNNSILFVLGHVTKEGTLAGPKILEHIVDTVLYFDTEKQSILRLLRVYKNRFGATNEIALFQMTQKGLLPITDTDTFFTAASRTKPVIGRAFSIILEGTRPILVELQALVAPTRYPFARRIVTGLDLNRCQILFAAIEKHLNFNLQNKDIFVSLAGGIKSKDPALDMAICASVMSSELEIALSHTSIFAGEIGILGQTAKISLMDLRLKEAQRLKFKEFVTCALSQEEKKHFKNLKITEIDELQQLLENLKS
ncbi:MAG TPA: DNA repair protein RadA [Elusimicrobiales bacterium]|nr:DNA repair protein RadA [Elusimicrobiales bacterium]